MGRGAHSVCFVDDEDPSAGFGRVKEGKLNDDVNGVDVDDSRFLNRAYDVQVGVVAVIDLTGGERRRIPLFIGSHEDLGQRDRGEPLANAARTPKKEGIRDPLSLDESANQAERDILVLDRVEDRHGGIMALWIGTMQ